VIGASRFAAWHRCRQAHPVKSRCRAALRPADEVLGVSFPRINTGGGAGCRAARVRRTSPVPRQRRPSQALLARRPGLHLEITVVHQGRVRQVVLRRQMVDVTLLPTWRPSWSLLPGGIAHITMCKPAGRRHLNDAARAICDHLASCPTWTLRGRHHEPDQQVTHCDEREQRLPDATRRHSQRIMANARRAGRSCGSRTQDEVGPDGRDGPQAFGFGIAHGGASR
jgi:hypothetical protein